MLTFLNSAWGVALGIGAILVVVAFIILGVKKGQPTDNQMPPLPGTQTRKDEMILGLHLDDPIPPAAK